MKGWESSEDEEKEARKIRMVLGMESDSCSRGNLESMLQEIKNIKQGGGTGEKIES